MRYKTVQTTNVVRFLAALHALKTRDVGEEGMGLLYGGSGEGKTTAVAYAANLHEAYYLRARSTWTKGSLLQALVRELGMMPLGRNDAMMRAAVGKLSAEPAPVFIDEADYLVADASLLDVVRDLYDLAQVPVVLIASETSVRRLRTGPRFERHRRRITQWVAFTGITPQDARKVAAELAEVEIEEALARRLFGVSRGNIGALAAGLRQIERFARANDLGAVTDALWDGRPLPSPGPQGFQPTTRS